MKKHILLFLLIASTTIISCSNDDDSGEKNQDPIVGTWILVDINPAQINIDQCEEQSTMTFNQNNTGSATFYFAEANCEPTTGTGVWKNEGNDMYSISVPLLGTLTGTVEFSGASTFFFTSDEGLTLTFERAPVL